jgi:Neprosin
MIEWAVEPEVASPTFPTRIGTLPEGNMPKKSRQPTMPSRVPVQKNPTPRYKRPAHTARVLSSKEVTQRLEAIRAFVAENRQRLNVETTTRTKSGQEIDWIRPESQVLGGVLASPPPMPRPSPKHPKQRTESAAIELETARSAQGSQGCVPVLRVNVERLRGSGSLDDFLSKQGRPAHILLLGGSAGIPVPGDGFGHRYARSIQLVTCFGGEGHINLWRPWVQWSNEMSLGQIGLFRGSPQLNQRQSVEAGWHVLPALYNDWDAHLFVFYTTNSYTGEGNNKGGYNQLVTGWVQVSSTIFPGAKFASTSVFAGMQREVHVRYQLYQGNWWLYVSGQWIGYYPASLFSSSGLQTSAAEVHFYGEVADDPNQPGLTKTDMGSGVLPVIAAGFGTVAYMRNLRYQSDQAGTMQKYIPDSVKGSIQFGYGIVIDSLNSNSWQSQLWWGGPGSL